jgi:hypothetical protein
MRRLKIITTGFLAVGIAILLSYPFTVGVTPTSRDKEVTKRYLARLTLYFGASTFSMLAAAFCASLIVKKTRLEFAEKKITNLETLLHSQAEALQRKPDANE